MKDDLWALIPAAGEGERTGFSEPKQFVVVAGKTMLEWTAEKVLALPEVSGIVIALPPGFEKDEKAGHILASLRQKGSKPVLAVPGGVNRQASVFTALQEVPKVVKWVTVHDASRPLFTADLFRRVLKAAKKVSAAICGISPVDTVKIVHTSKLHIESTFPRENMILVQTPQIFEHSLLHVAHEQAAKDGFIGTDDSQLVERLGHQVAVVPGERTNIKITFPEDFILMENLLESDAQVDLDEVDGFCAVGCGFDVHPLVTGRKCVIGGVEIPFERGLSGHSDADVLCHAICDAILGAFSMGDIGKWYPPGDLRFKDGKSLDFLTDIGAKVSGSGRIVHVDCTIVAQSPKMQPHIEEMRENISRALDIEKDRVSVKATSPEHIGSLGRGEGIAAFCTATVFKKGRG